jgi:hypothetical protein
MAAKNTEQKKFLSKLTPEDIGGIAGGMVFVLGNGVRVEFELDSCTEGMIRKLALHGASQKIGDSTSGFSKDRDFHSAFGTMQGIVDNLYNDVWSSRSGGGSADLVKALAELQGATLEEVQAVVDTMTEEQLAEVKGNKQVKAKIAEYVSARATEAAKTVKTEDLSEIWAKIAKKTGAAG